ncbi:MAG: hypothetical protein IJ134_01570 [Bacilli bacterium]|nr:hypothetical protein [Bacilli bacterium]
MTDKWFNLTLEEIKQITNEKTQKKYLYLYNVMWQNVVIPLSELLNCNLDIIGKVTIKNVVDQYREALKLIGISKEEQDKFIRDKYNKCQ